MNEYHIEQLLTNFALRKSYGTKPKEVNIYSDTNKKALWCWEIQDHQLLEPVTDGELKKARIQRAITGKKLQTLNTMVEIIKDFSTFDSPEKISKLNQEFENYNKLIIRENAPEWIMKKRRYTEVEQSEPHLRQ